MKPFWILTLAILSSGTFAFAEEAPPAVVTAPAKDAESASKQGIVTPDLLTMRDPFKKPGAIEMKELTRSPLESFNAEEFRMTGVITGMDRLKAMISDPSGATHFVSEGMRIGTRKGVIKKIQSNSIKIRERLPNILGGEDTVEVEIRMAPESGLSALTGNPPLVSTQVVDDKKAVPGSIRPPGQ